jgi:hypothetical protein
MRDIPIIPPLDLPAEEQPAVNTINGGLMNMRRFFNQFAHAVSLFNWCEGQISRLKAEQPSPNTANDLSIIRNWKNIAGRDAAMAIFHFGDSMGAISGMLKLSPTIAVNIDRTSLSRANKHFARNFPNFVQMRHGVAHAAEALKSPSKLEEHQSAGYRSLFMGQNAKIIVQDAWDDRRFLTTWRTKILACELSEATCESLHIAEDAYFAAFEAAANAEIKKGMAIRGNPSWTPKSS